MNEPFKSGVVSELVFTEFSPSVAGDRDKAFPILYRHKVQLTSAAVMIMTPHSSTDHQACVTVCIIRAVPRCHNQLNISPKIKTLYIYNVLDTYILCAQRLINHHLVCVVQTDSGSSTHMLPLLTKTHVAQL